MLAPQEEWVLDSEHSAQAASSPGSPDNANTRRIASTSSASPSNFTLRSAALRSAAVAPSRGGDQVGGGRSHGHGGRPCAAVSPARSTANSNRRSSISMRYEAFRSPAVRGIEGQQDARQKPVQRRQRAFVRHDHVEPERRDRLHHRQHLAPARLAEGVDGPRDWVAVAPRDRPGRRPRAREAGRPAGWWRCRAAVRAGHRTGGGRR